MTALVSRGRMSTPQQVKGRTWAACVVVWRADVLRLDIFQALLVELGQPRIKVTVQNTPGGVRGITKSDPAWEVVFFVLDNAIQRRRADLHSLCDIFSCE